MNNLSLNSNDSFANFTFTSSGHLVLRNNDKTQEKCENTEENKENTCLKVSVDDSAFFNDSFSFSALQNLTQLELEAEKTANAQLKVVKQTETARTLKKNKKETKNTSSLDFKPLDVTLTPTKNKKQNESVKFKQKTAQSAENNVKKPTVIISEKRVVSTDGVRPPCPAVYEFSQSETHKLSALGLPEQILRKYECRAVTRMFPWQLECLSLEGVLDNCRNLIYSAPTSAGKTLVAEILAIKTVLERSKKVIFILPFVSVVREKMFYFQDIFGSSGIRVEGFMGSYNPPGGFKSVNVAICTIEKANSLVNRLLEEGKLADIGAVIVDELHLLGDPSRGYLLELLLTKLRFVTMQQPEVQIQVVGMSATLPNLHVLGKWLSAQVYVTDFRPIPLYEQCLVRGDIRNPSMSVLRRLEPIPDFDTDTDNVLQLCLETLLMSCSVLVFCPTKNWCESLAVQISTAFFKLGSSKTKLGADLRAQLHAEPIAECLEQLKRSPSGLDEILHKTVSFGVAFHHAGLTMDERDIIESGFRSSALRVLVATSTLSSGVNLPARRVIIRTAMFFGKPMDILVYKQMVGRAGRMGKDTAGESILICKENELKVAQNLMEGQLAPISSCLLGSGRLKRALLEVIASGVATTQEAIDTFGTCTLLSQETTHENPLADSLDFLLQHQFVRVHLSDEGQSYVATPLAKACLSSSMPPEEGLELFAELEKARQCFVLETELHLIYLVTPYSAQIGTIDWMQFLNLYEKLPASMKRVGELVGIKVSFIINATRGKNSNAAKLALHRRFYTALALQDLVNEVPLNVVADKYNCNRGALQGLQLSAASFAGMVTAFSKQLGWNSVELLVGQFQDRLQFGVSRELLDLMKLPLLNGQRARILFDAGYLNLVDLAAGNVYDLENVLLKAKPFESKEREGESEHEAKKRLQLRTIFITGKQGLTELEAATLMIKDARRYLQYEIGLNAAKWSQGPVPDKDKDVTLNGGLIEKPAETEIIEEKVEVKAVPSVCDQVGNTTLNSFEISRSPKSIQIDLETVANLDSLRLSDQVVSISPSPNLPGEKHERNRLSAESLFNDSFDAQWSKFDQQFTIAQDIEDKEQCLEKQVSDLDDSGLTKAFMTSFDSMSFNKSCDTVAEGAPGLSREPEREQGSKRTRLHFCYSDADDDGNSDEDVFPGGTPPKQMKPSPNSTENEELSIEIITVCDTPHLFNVFYAELSKQATIGLALATVKHQEEKRIIGLRQTPRTKPAQKFVLKDLKVVGICVYWPLEAGPTTNTTYFIDLEKIEAKNLQKLQKEILLKKLLIFNAKEQLKLMHLVLDWEVEGVYCEDPNIADWLLEPEGGAKDLGRMVRAHAKELEKLLELSKEKEGEIWGALNALLAWKLTELLMARLIAEDPQFTQCLRDEMQVVVILAKMELNGFPVNLKTLQHFADTLKAFTNTIEAEAFNIAGRRFSFTSPAAIAKVLASRARQPLRSTNKAALVQYDHPLAPLIINWRKINNTLANMIFPLLRCIQNGRIHGSCITQNATGRVSMQEPNLQNVPRDFQFVDPNGRAHDISIRAAFEAPLSAKTVLVGADYCQLELRLLAHLSQDGTLCRIMRSQCHIFKSIAAKWMKLAESEVDDTLRQQTKQICYGIIYGIGNKSLAEQMSITEQEALDFVATFHLKYPGIKRFTKATIENCQRDEYVETLLGRRRYLPGINSTNSTEKSKAERQAVNTTVQGSAADIAKQAMILVDAKVRDKFRASRNMPKLILQLHDELLYEVPQKYEDVFAKILQKCMQQAVTLSVPLPVKVHSGKSWGTLVPKVI